MFYTVYRITNKVDGKIYIGKHQTNDLNDGYMGSGKQLKRAQSKHGIENFEKEILFQFGTEEEMNDKEAELVSEEFCSRDDTYNLCPGGQGGWGYTNNIIWAKEKRLEHNRKVSGFSSMTKEKRKLVGKAGIASLSKEQRLKGASNGGKAGKGRNITEEHKAKISASRKGSNGHIGLIWITNGLENRKINKDLPIPEGWYRGRKDGCR